MEENDSLVTKEAATNMKLMRKPPRPSLKINLDSLNQQKSFFSLKSDFKVPLTLTPLRNTETNPQLYDMF